MLMLTDASLAGVIFVAPLVLGGRHDLGRFVFIALVSVGAAAWFARQAIIGEQNRPHWPARILFGLAALLLCVQVAPLPAAWLARLSPRTVDLLTLWTGIDDPGELGDWATLSLAPTATRLALAMLVSYGLLFFTVLARLREERDVMRVVKWIGLSAGLMAAIGLVQFLAPNGKYLWVYEHPSRDASQRLSGPFANRNHFAHFLALGVPALAAWLTLRLHRSGPATSRQPALQRTSARRPVSRDRESLIAAGLLVLVAATALLTCSRGGALALVVAGGVAMLALYRVGLLDGRRTAALAAASGAVFLAVSLTGYEHIADRLGTLAAESLDELDESAARRKIWTANVAAIRDGGWFGAGAGSHSDIYPSYLADPPTVQYTHAESGYLQILTENGPVGGAILVAAVAMAAGSCFRALRHAQSPQAKGCAAAATAALAASAVHSLCDFVWYIPACLSPVLILAACAVRLGEIHRGESRSHQSHSAARPTMPQRRLAAAWAGGAALAGLFAVSQFLGPAAAALHWDAYLRMSSAHRDFIHNVLAMPPEEAAPALAQSRAAQRAALESMIAELAEVLRSYPACHAAHSALANRCLQLFNLKQAESDNPMPASQIFGAAAASQFRSSGELRAWLDRAVGANSQWLDRAYTHARAAVRLAPLEGEAYAALAEVCFLAGEGVPEADAYLAQATRVRPYDGDLLFEIGVQWASRGALEPALACWAEALRIKGPHRVQAARCLAGQFPIAEIIKRYSPQWDTLPEHWRVVRSAGPTEISAFLTYAEEQARRETVESPPFHAARVWRTLAEIEADANRPARVLAILAHSSRLYPEDYLTRRMFGFALVKAGLLDEGMFHLEWCLDRRAGDAAVKRQLEQAGRERLASRVR
jgi:tetratricopeptide (TPR) repeat protein